MVIAPNQERFKCFLKVTINYLVKDDNTTDVIEEIKHTFSQYIDDNPDNLPPFLDKLPYIREDLKKDLDFYMISDPAINSKEEVILAYPGYKAIVCYRISHVLFEIGLKVKARLISELAHSITGIDIHPGAKIDVPFFIDHGTGIVIGETTIIKSRVKLYQGVTLGAISLENAMSLKGVKRHPTIEEGVTIYSCASILGDITIGKNSTIGANVFLTESVQDNMKVTIGKPQLVIKEKKK